MVIDVRTVPVADTANTGNRAVCVWPQVYFMQTDNMLSRLAIARDKVTRRCPRSRLLCCACWICRSPAFSAAVSRPAAHSAYMALALFTHFVAPHR